MPSAKAASSGAEASASDGRRGLLGRHGCRRADRHNSADLEVDQLCGQRREPFAFAFVKSVLESDVPAFDPPVRPKLLDHRPEQSIESRGTGSSDRDQADPVHFAGLLRFDSNRSDERTNSHPAEGAPVHSIT